MASSPFHSWQFDGEKMDTVTGFIFLGSKVTADGDCSHGIKRHLLLGRKAMTDFANKALYSQSYGFSSSHVWMWELDHKEIWAPKNWCFRPVVLMKTLESPLDCKDIQPVNPKGNQSRIFIGRTDAEVSNTLATWCKEFSCWVFFFPCNIFKVNPNHPIISPTRVLIWWGLGVLFVFKQEPVNPEAGALHSSEPTLPAISEARTFSSVFCVCFHS